MKRTLIIRITLLMGIMVILNCCKKGSGENQIEISPGNTIVDSNFNTYKTVKIGTQVWMAENLKTLKFATGDTIPTTITSYQNVENELTPIYQWIRENDDTYLNTYGRLYTWYAVTDSRGVCPKGWHIPYIEEWDLLISNLGGTEVAGGKLKEVGFNHWLDPNTGATNYSLFTALPAGGRVNGGIGSRYVSGLWWSASQMDNNHAWSYSINYDSNMTFLGHGVTSWGFSVRCIMD